MHGRSELGRKLRREMPGYFPLNGPFETTVERYGIKGDPIVTAPNGDHVVLDDYNGFKKPGIGQTVRAEVVTDRAPDYSFGRILKVYPNSRFLRSAIRLLNR